MLVIYLVVYSLIYISHQTLMATAKDALTVKYKTTQSTTADRMTLFIRFSDGSGSAS